MIDKLRAKEKVVAVITKSDKRKEVIQDEGQCKRVFRKICALLRWY